MPTTIVQPATPSTDLSSQENPPTEAEVLAALPRMVNGIPYLYEGNRDNIQIVFERLGDQIDPTRFFPLVGPAQMHHRRWKCTVYCTENIDSTSPYPLRLNQPRIDVVYIDKAYLEPVSPSKPATPQQPRTAFQELNYDQAIEKGKSDKKWVMVEFLASWCGPSKKLDADTFSEQKVQKLLKDKTVAIKVNIDENEKLCKQYKITAIPCLVFLDGEGKEAGRILGFKPADKFLEEAEKIIK